MSVRIAVIATAATLFIVSLGTAGSVQADDRHHYDRRENQRHYYYPYKRHYYRPPHYRRYNSDDDEKLLFGLLVGGLFGYAIGHSQQFEAPPPSPPSPAPEQYYGRPPSTCLQEREYQMKVMVGGKEVDAYGTACLQPDGSWYRGPAQVVPR